MSRTIRNIVILCTLFFASLYFSSCRPHGVLSSRQMRSLLVDLHKTDALLQVSGLQYGHNEAEDIYYAMVLEQHGITQAQFDSSLVWYTAHPQLFDKIYPKVLAQLAQEREAFLAANEEDLAPILRDECPAAPELTLEQTRLRVDSLIWTMQHPRPVYGWIPGWHAPVKEPIVPFPNDQ